MEVSSFTFTLLILLSLSKHSLAIGEPCILAPDSCNATAFLICVRSETEIGKSYCQCDISKALENPQGTNCVPFPSSVGESCEDFVNDNFCRQINGTVCNGKTCECDDHEYFHIPPQPGCTKYSDSLNDICIPNTQQCKNINGSSCSQSDTEFKCLCNATSHLPDLNNTSCIQYCSNLNETCQPETEQCKNVGEGVICNQTTKMCACDLTNGWDDPAIDQRSCIKVAERVNEPCQSTFNCRNVPNTLCNNNSVCACVPRSVESEDHLSCVNSVFKLNSTCNQTSQCVSGIGENAVCGDGQCTCKANFVGDGVLGNSADRCLPISTVNEDCEIKAQCENALGSEGDCILGKCRCKATSVLIREKCVLRVPLNSNCSLDDECILGSNSNSRCILTNSGIYTCQCVNGTSEVHGMCYSRPHLSDQCIDDGECQSSIGGRVSCTNGLCKCDFGTLPSFDLLSCSSATLNKAAIVSAILVVFYLLSEFME